MATPAEGIARSVPVVVLQKPYRKFKKTKTAEKVRVNLCLPQLNEVDHIVAVKHRGTTDADNLAFACWRCNRYQKVEVAFPQREVSVLIDHWREKWVK